MSKAFSLVPGISIGRDWYADNAVVAGSGCTVTSGWQYIMRVFYVGRSCEFHQRRIEERLERREDCVCVMSAVLRCGGHVRLM